MHRERGNGTPLDGGYGDLVLEGDYAKALGGPASPDGPTLDGPLSQGLTVTRTEWERMGFVLREPMRR